jgi:hypothetical protein
MISMKYLRAGEWWGHILPPIMLFYYAGLCSMKTPESAAYYTAGMLLALAVITAIAGYFLNDLSDVREDALAGKKNYIGKLPLPVKAAFLPLLCFAVYLLAGFNPGMLSAHAKQWFVFVFMANGMLFALYSLPPVRIKKNPWLAPVLDALYSGTLFYGLAYALAAEKSVALHASCLQFTSVALWGFLKGLRNYLTHVCDDEQNDRAAGLKTLATLYGSATIQRAANLFFPAEIACLLIFIFLLPSGNMAAAIMSVLFLFYWLKKNIRSKYEKHVFLNDLHEVWLPLAFLIQLVYRTGMYGFLLLHILVFPYHLYKVYCLFDRIYFYTLFRWIGPLRGSRDDRRSIP